MDPVYFLVGLALGYMITPAIFYGYLLFRDRNNKSSWF